MIVRAHELKAPQSDNGVDFRADWGPLEYAAYATQPCALTIVQRVEGPSYRPVGAMMTVTADGKRNGSLSSGCVEADIVHHAMDALERRKTKTLRYGHGSPFFDIVLPCGGRLDILIVPHPDKKMLRLVVERLKQRLPITLNICAQSGQIFIAKGEETFLREGHLFLKLVPELQFLIFGKGPETVDFAALAWASGYKAKVFSPDPETLLASQFFGEDTVELHTKQVPKDIRGDFRTAAILFFHDHDWEPGLLRDLLNMELYYIGAQGSRNAKLLREERLRAFGVCAEDIARIHGPIGLIPSARDSRTLAISVLAELVALAS